MLDHELLVPDLRAGLVPHIAATRAEPIDYDVLTSQVVGPHISQLIELAPDKHEMVGLIVDRLTTDLPPYCSKYFPMQVARSAYLPLWHKGNYQKLNASWCKNNPNTDDCSGWSSVDCSVALGWATCLYCGHNLRSMCGVSRVMNGH